MSNGLPELAQRLVNELDELAQMVERVQSAWQRFQHSSDSFYLDSVALNLHSFYNGLEHLFELIAIHVDGARPEGTNWHQALLAQMASEIPQIRPAVISEPSCDRLNDYRRFRHIVRHTYTFQFDAERIEPFIDAIAPTFAQVQDEIAAFAIFLQNRA